MNTNPLTQNFGEPKSRARHKREKLSQWQVAFDTPNRESMRIFKKVTNEHPELRDIAAGGYDCSINLLNRLSRLPSNDIALVIEAIKNGGHPREVINYYISQNPDVSLEEQKKRKISINAYSPDDAAYQFRSAWAEGRISSEYLKELTRQLHWFCSGDEE